jgi:hypothetical protein
MVLNSNINNTVITGRPNLILLGFAAMLGISIIIIVIYIIRQKNKQSGTSDNTNTATVTTNPVSYGMTLNNGDANILSKDDKRMPLDEKEVYNIARNIYALEDAEAACKVFDGKIATMDQLIDAHKQGANWCNVGWTKDGIAAFPVQAEIWNRYQENIDPNKRNECGLQPGINVAKSDKHLLYGVNCYGTKPQPRGMEKLMNKYMSDREKQMLLKYNEFNKNKSDMTLQPFNEHEWSAWN